MRYPFVGLASVACLAASASGQGVPTYDARLCFALGNAAGGMIIDDNDASADFTVSAPGNYQFQVVAGIFNAMNFDMIPSPPGVPQPSSNRGIGNWIGGIALAGHVPSDNLNIRTPAPARVPPFNFGLKPVIEVDLDHAITGIVAARGAAVVAWPFGIDPAPQPASLGNEMFTRMYRFNIDILDIDTPRDILITADGTMVAIANWGILEQTPPEDGLDGSTNWAPVPAGAPRVAESCVLRIRVVPAPGAAALLGLGGLVTARRRRA